MKFPNKYDVRDVLVSCPGRSEADTYTPVVSDSGRIDLMPTGTVDLYEEIQSHADSVDIHLLLQRFTLGDPDAVDLLNTQRGIYADITEMPKTYAELYQRVIDCQNYFDSLPIDVKEKYNNSVVEFMSQSESAVSNIAPISDKPVEEVHSDES